LKTAVHLTVSNESFMQTNDLTAKLALMRSYFKTGVTKPYTFRIEQLKKLKAAIYKYEQELHDALYADLKKSKEESWVTESALWKKN
jgi:aldehyde dehydrogenase (NAD+)